MTDVGGDWDAQDQSEVFDEDNVSLDGTGDVDGEMRTFEEMEDVLDVTSAVGDADDDAALIGEELDDDEIIDLEVDASLSDYEDDDAYALMPEAFDDDSLGEEDIEEVGYDGERNLEGRRDTGLTLKDDPFEDVNDAERPSDEAQLSFVADLEGLSMRRGRASRMESSGELSNEDLEDLGYRDANGVK